MQMVCFNTAPCSSANLPFFFLFNCLERWGRAPKLKDTIVSGYIGHAALCLERKLFCNYGLPRLLWCIIGMVSTLPTSEWVGTGGNLTSLILSNHLCWNMCLTQASWPLVALVLFINSWLESVEFQWFQQVILISDFKCELSVFSGVGSSYHCAALVMTFCFDHRVFLF